MIMQSNEIQWNLEIDKYSLDVNQKKRKKQTFRNEIQKTIKEHWDDKTKQKIKPQKKQQKKFCG